MFVKGSASWPHAEGSTPKADCLKIKPDCICKRVWIRGNGYAYAIYRSPNEMRPAIVRGTAREAWAAMTERLEDDQ